MADHHSGKSGKWDQGSSVQWRTQRAAGSTVPLGVSWDRWLGMKGKVLASNGQIVCLFLWVPLNPTRGISSLSLLYWGYLLTTLQPSKHSKAGKRSALAADQQDIFTVDESICYREMASVSSRMFGNPSSTFLALRRSDIPLHLIFSLKKRCVSGVSEQQVKDLPVWE